MNAHRPTEPTDSWVARREAVVARGVPRATDFVIVSALGAVLTDVDGREILDFGSGIGVMSLGHSDPVVVAAVQAQMASLQHVCMHITTYPGYVELCERLVELLPHQDPALGATKAMLVNSGAEAVENAVKIARQFTGRSAVICYTGAFHGRTLMGMSLTSKVAYKQNCGPFAPELYRLPFPNLLRRGDLSVEAYVQQELRRFRQTLVDTVAASDVAAVVIEPIQGEGGFVTAPVSYLRGLRSICDEHGIVLVFDEVQSGFCRTGGWGAYQVLGVTPDLSTWAKAMGGGLPIASVIGRAAVMDGAIPGTIGGTFGGNPVACAAALATLSRMEDLDLNARAVRLGHRLRAGFEELASRHVEVVQVRGMGAMLAMELCEAGDLSRPAAKQVSEIRKVCERDGLLVLSAGVRGNVIRALPPLIITDAQVDLALEILTSAFEEVLS